MEEKEEKLNLPQFELSQVWDLKVDQPFSQVKFESGVKNAINSIIQEYPVLSVFQNYPYLAGNIGGAYIPDNIDIWPKMFDKVKDFGSL